MRIRNVVLCAVALPALYLIATGRTFEFVRGAQLLGYLISVPAVQAGVLAIAVIGAVAIGLRMGRARKARSVVGSANDDPSGVMGARLDRIERAIEAIAIEVERIGEMERSAAKILAARSPETDIRPVTPGPFPAKVTTPH